MKTDIRINYSVLEEIRGKISTYKSALETMEEALNKINKRLVSGNSGEAINALKEIYNNLQDKISSCKKELDGLYNIFNGYINEMQEIIQPENNDIMMQVDKYDIWSKMQSIFSACDAVGSIRDTVSSYGSSPSLLDSDEEKRNQERNGRKIEEIHDMIKKYHNLLEDNENEMQSLYNNKIIPYADKDAEYANLAEQVLDNSMAEVVKASFKDLPDKIVHDALKDDWENKPVKKDILDNLIDWITEDSSPKTQRQRVIEAQYTGMSLDIQQFSSEFAYDSMGVARGVASIDRINEILESEVERTPAVSGINTFRGSGNPKIQIKSPKDVGLKPINKVVTQSSYKEINIHGKINTELDEVDLVSKIIYEDKSAGKLYMENPDFPQTEVQWAEKQILKKGSNRINALRQSEFKLSSQVSNDMPSVEELKNINDYVFRIDADTPQLREAVQTQLEKLKVKYPEFNFSAKYGGKK